MSADSCACRLQARTRPSSGTPADPRGLNHLMLFFTLFTATPSHFFLLLKSAVKKLLIGYQHNHDHSAPDCRLGGAMSRPPPPPCNEHKAQPSLGRNNAARTTPNRPTRRMMGARSTHTEFKTRHVLDGTNVSSAHLPHPTPPHPSRGPKSHAMKRMLRIENYSFRAGRTN